MFSFQMALTWVTHSATFSIVPSSSQKSEQIIKNQLKVSITLTIISGSTVSIIKTISEKIVHFLLFVFWWHREYV